MGWHEFRYYPERMTFHRPTSLHRALLGLKVIVKHFLRPIIKIIEPFIIVLHPGSFIYFQFKLQRPPSFGRGDGVRGTQKGKERAPACMSSIMKYTPDIQKGPFIFFESSRNGIYNEAIFRT